MKHARVFIMSALLATTAFPVTQTMAAGTDTLALSVGAYDAFDDNGATDFRVEYRPGTSIVWELRPYLAVEVTSDGALFGGGGFLYDYNLGSQWFLTPSLGASLYSDGSSGQDLGGSVQFREQIEIGYEFQNSSRLSGAISHLSNWGTNDRNPGADVFSVYYSIPMNWVKQGPGSN